MKEYYFESIDSTSKHLKENYNTYDDMTFVSSDFQTQGHGRYNRKWHSNKGENLLFSILIKDKELVNRYAMLSLSSAVVIYELLVSKKISNVSIKWPNDVYVNDKKIAGILLESISFENRIEALVLGVGINVNSVNFEKEIEDKTTSLKIESNQNYLIKEIKDEIYKRLLDMFYKIKKDDFYYLDIIRKNNYLKGKKVYAKVNGDEVFATVIDINSDNNLMIEYNNHLYEIFSGEIKLIN